MSARIGSAAMSSASIFRACSCFPRRSRRRARIEKLRSAALTPATISGDMPPNGRLGALVEEAATPTSKDSKGVGSEAASFDAAGIDAVAEAGAGAGAGSKHSETADSTGSHVSKRLGDPTVNWSCDGTVTPAASRYAFAKWSNTTCVDHCDTSAIPAISHTSAGGIVATPANRIRRIAQVAATSASARCVESGAPKARTRSRSRCEVSRGSAMRARSSESIQVFSSSE